MRKNKRMNYYFSQNGFTLVNCLFAFSLFLMMSSLLPIIIQFIKVEPRTVPYSVDLFFTYIQKEIVRANQLVEVGSTLYLNMGDGSIVRYEKYQSNIRRQVNGAGNEFLLQNVDDVSYELVPNGVIVSIDLYGKTFQKRISKTPKIF
ncbi:competence type IV pilus minor pilin ComGF [Calidifontibacillus erzurumensis]|uniref:competence type IV pilus minor pilin ComGF n=1 Tax=Calidifontibacillus erzurumensis TaxID=2741433 RepID=UPI0035B55224